MSSQYSVIRFVPDPIAGECLNLGVVTWDQNRIRCKFVNNWSRLRAFGTDKIDFLRAFAREMHDATERQIPLFPNGGASFAPDDLSKIISGWSEKIQFSSPRGSIKEVDALLADVTPLFLRQQRPRRTGPRTRAAAAKAAASILLEAVRRRVPDNADQLVKKRELVHGAIEQHQLDVALANGHLIAGVQAISFEINVSEHLEKEILAIKWALADIRRLHPVPMAVFALPPGGGGARAAYTGARRAFKALEADLVTTPRQMEAWAAACAEAIPVAA